MKIHVILGCVLLGVVGCGAASEKSEAELKQEFAAYVAARNQCSVNEDCALVVAGCPLGCYGAVNRVFQAEVEAKAHELVSEYEESRGSCVVDCIVSAPACTHGRCQAVPQ